MWRFEGINKCQLDKLKGCKILMTSLKGSQIQLIAVGGSLDMSKFTSLIKHQFYIYFSVATHTLNRQNHLMA